MLQLIQNIGTVTKKLPAFHNFLVSIYHFFVLEVWPRLRFPHRYKRKQNLHDGLKKFLSLQTIQRIDLKFSTPEHHNDLVKNLKRLQIPHIEGGWTIYLPPSDGLDTICPEIKKYPPGSGIKILRHFAPPLDVSYTSKAIKNTPGASYMRSKTPSAIELLRIAGILCNEGIGPKVYDLVELKINEAIGTAYIVEHIDAHEKVNASDYRIFIKKLAGFIDQQVVGINHGDYRFSTDFKEPDCNRNLLKDRDGQLFYVDFQSFHYRDEKRAFQNWSENHREYILFGPKRYAKKQDYLYQMIPGIGDAKRETLIRWRKIDQLLEKAGIELEGRCTFDIGCNSGLMSYYALSRGARWAYGWDRQIVAKAAGKLLRLLGATRWNAYGIDIEKETDFNVFLPNHVQKSNDGVLLYLAISKHIGFPASIASLPWQYCIYEGHSGQNLESSISNIRKSKWTENLNILAHTTLVDGDSPKRVLIIFSR